MGAAHDQESQPERHAMQPPDDRPTSDDIFASVYEELRRLAQDRLSRERPGHTLRPTELVHEVYFRLSKSPGLIVTGRAHMLGLAGLAMRRILVEHARRKGAAKRGAHPLRVTLDEAAAFIDAESIDILALDMALTRLAEEDAPAAEVVQHKYFAGLTEPEIGELMGKSERWVRTQWNFAKMWLRRELDPER